MLGTDWEVVVQAILFALFSVVTAIVAAVIGPTYDNLLVPELSPAALYPPLVPPANSVNYLTGATQFSTYALVNIVDPAIALVAIGVAVLYLFRSFVARWSYEVDALLPRLVLAVVAANFTVPIASGILDLGGGLYPVLSGWDGGAWQHWVNLAGWGEFSYSWDNGALSFVLSLVEFTLVLGLVLAVALRDALLAVLIVLLPIFTLLWPFRPLAPLARRAWLLFVELVFLPCVMIVPLELAVGSSNPVELVAYLGCALSSPLLLSLAGTHLTSFGVPGSSTAIASGTQRGLQAGPAVATSYAAPAMNSSRGAGSIGQSLASTGRSAGSAALPVAAPLAAGQLVGQGAVHLLRHLRASATSPGSGRAWPPIRGRGSP
jgi:hypothetical protein